MRRRRKPAKSSGASRKPAARRGPAPRADTSTSTAGTSPRELEARLVEAQEQIAATGAILRVIADSPAAVEPVLAAVLASAGRLCGGDDVGILRVVGDELWWAAGRGPWISSVPEDLRIPLTRGSVATRAVVDRASVHVLDFLAEPDAEYPVGRELARRFGHRAMLAVPLLREGVAIGVICAFRLEPRAFAPQQIALLETFAAQAAIAIENVRLFNELGQKNAALTAAHAQVTETLEQQTATAEILRVISSSPTDVQPVFDAIAASAASLCEAETAGLFRFDGELIHFVAQHGRTPEEIDAARRAFPQPPSHRSVTARAILGRGVVQIEDVGQDTDAEDALRIFATVLSVPLLRDGRPLGAITVARRVVKPFTDKQIALVRTFAEQAVIAIENVRLFNELREKNSALAEALEQQTATAEILRVISSSPTDLQPVFDAIVRSTLELCDAQFCVAYRYDGAQLHVVAHDNLRPETLALLNTRYPQAPSGETATGVSVLERRIVHIPDATTAEGVPPGSYAFARAQGWASLLAVPLLRDGQPIGNIAVARVERGPFGEQQIALVQTFADQAVIAIENVRLLRELQARTDELTRSVEQLTALGEVGRAVSSTLDLQTVLGTIVARATQLAGVDAGIIYEYDERQELFEPRATHQLEDEIVRALEASPIRKGDGATGRLADVPEPVQLADIRGTSLRGQAREALLRAGYRALLAVPLLREEQLIGGLTVFRKAPGEYGPDVVELLRAFATQSALAIQNARLFREIEDKSRELEAASRHKSEFLANMSHELRTPLNAIIGFSEVLTERMFGALNDKQDEYLRDIYASGQHLLSLINDILDLSKVEAGRMELELSDFDLAMAIDNALMLVRERAGRRGIALAQSIGEGVGSIRADERKVRQVLLNLLSNALKFTPEGGRVDVAATVRDKTVEVSVADTGVGIAPADQEAVFEEFRQVGTAAKKVEGTGLGLTLCRKFVALHGGRIWVESRLGEGARFTFSLPLAREA